MKTASDSLNGLKQSYGLSIVLTDPSPADGPTLGFGVLLEPITIGGKVMGLDVLGDGVSLTLRETRPLVDSLAISSEVVQS